MLITFSALLLWAAFPPVNAWPLAWGALVPLLCALDRVRSRRGAFGLAWTAGFIFFLLVLQWIHFVTTLGLVLLSAYCALYFGVFGLLYLWARCRLGFLTRCLFLPASWVLLEYVRSVAFTGFGWAGLGDTQASFNRLVPLVSWTGAGGLAFVVAGVNIIAKEALFGEKKRDACRAGGVILVMLGIVMLFSLFGGRAGHGNGFKAALIQPNTALAESWDPRLKEEVVHRLIDLSRRSLAGHPKLIVWPETAFPNFIWDQPGLMDEVRTFTRENRVYLLFGAVTREKEKYYNSAVLIGPSGDVIGTRSKRHLVLFGEYIPFRRQFPFLQDIVPIDDFTPGAEEALFDVPGLGKFGVLICFEDTISGLAAQYTRQGAEFLVNITNDAWFGDSGQPAMHGHLAALRSAENHRPLIRATNTGESCVIGADGVEQACIKDNQGHRVRIEGFMVASIYPEVGMTWYTKCEGLLIVVCLAIVAAIVAASLRRQRKTPGIVRNKVLLIDDERTLHTMLKSVLGAYGFDVVSAMNGEEGLALAVSERPGLILLDVILPTIKGREVCRRLKASRETAHIPVLFLTAKDSQDDVKAELEVGAAGHISKPINSSSLVKLVKKTILS